MWKDIVSYFNGKKDLENLCKIFLILLIKTIKVIHLTKYLNFAVN